MPEGTLRRMIMKNDLTEMICKKRSETQKSLPELTERL